MNPTTSVTDSLTHGGRRLWERLIAQDASLDDELNPNRDVALEACRAKDRCDILDGVCQSEPVLLDNGKGQPVTHPAWVEARQQANMLKQLVAALRLPDDATGKRPQRHTGPAAGRRPSAGTGAAVSSLERARAAKGS